jgi:hypothetical protein
MLPTTDGMHERTLTGVEVPIAPLADDLSEIVLLVHAWALMGALPLQGLFAQDDLFGRLVTVVGVIPRFVPSILDGLFVPRVWSEPIVRNGHLGLFACLLIV